MHFAVGCSLAYWIPDQVGDDNAETVFPIFGYDKEKPIFRD
jgi:hypothetical protein